ncbi:MAG: hypothetical protein B7C24_08840 [Bacteroidetes bacterium 4572_77]|nr:MAG: hypothetical protein B7C24_08840 [Bacteroidetes bacterium 4572_77]
MKFFNKNKEEDRLQEAFRRLPEGSAEAFRYLFSTYRESVYRYCLKMLGGDSELAKDAFQETFIKVFENRFKFTGEKFQNWVLTIARNTCINMLRVQKESLMFDEAYIGGEKDETVDFMLKEKIEKAINSLPAQLKEAFLLREYNDLKYNDIAEILDVDVSLAKIRVFRARKKLQSIIKPIIE